MAGSSKAKTKTETKIGQTVADVSGNESAPEKKRLTEDLLERLLASSSIEAYLGDEAPVDRALPDYLNELLAEKGLKRSEVIRASGINPTFAYDIFSGKSKPRRDHAIMLAFGLQCDLRQTQRLLRQAGVSELWPKIRRDAIVIWCIEQGLSRERTDDELFRFGERTLLRTGNLA